MDVNWTIVFFTVVISLLVIGIVIWYRLQSTLPPKITNEIDNVLPKLKTGDLLFVNYRSKHGRIIRIATKTFWSHIGMVIVIDDDTYVIEVADYSEEYEGLCLIPIADWLDINSSRYCGYSPIDKSIPADSIQVILEEYKGTTLDMDLFNWAQTLGWKENRYVTKKSYFCSEFIALLMQKLGLLSCEKDPACYSPERLMGLRGYGNLDVFYLD